MAATGAPRQRSLAALCTLAVATLLPLSACNIDKSLTFEEKDVVTPEQLTDASSLPALLAGAQAEFQGAYIGNSAVGGTGGDSQITMSALMTDEFFDVETFPTRVEVDQRTIQNTNGTMLPVYRAQHLARAAAERAAGAYARLDSTNVGRSEVLALSGYSYVVFGENYCSGVPSSRQDDASGELVYGDPIPTLAQFDSAIVRFDAAITLATRIGTTATARLNLARVGRGRALLNQGKFAEAAAAVTAVPTNFSYQVFGSENSARENNGVYVLSSANGNRYAGGPSTKAEPNGLNFIDADPRAVSTRAGTATGFDGFNAAYYQQKYTSRSAPAVVGDGVEARLIEAEAALQANNLATFLTQLNAARTQRLSTLPALTAADVPAARAGQVDLLFKERGYNLWLTSHRLGDFRRLIRQYGRPANSVFPTGTYPTLGPQKGVGRYVEDVNFPIPFEESNNPQFSKAGGQCIDRKA